MSKVVIKRMGRGVVPEVPAIRDYDYEVVHGELPSGAQIQRNYPSEFCLGKRYVGILKDQGRINCCVGCTTSSINEVINLIKKYGDLDSLSEQEWEEVKKTSVFSEGWVYGALREGYEGEGMFVSTTMDQWRKKGMVPQNLFDIVQEVPDILKTVQKFPELQDKAPAYKIDSYLNLGYANLEKRDAAIKDALTTYGYGLVAVSDSYFGGSHCITLVGWNDKKNTYKIKNSWGDEWGDEQGIGEIPKKQVNWVYLPLSNPLELPFIDVATTDWFYKDVKNIYFGGIMKGEEDNRFNPEGRVTRAQGVVTLNRIAQMFDERLTALVKLAKEKNLLHNGCQTTLPRTSNPCPFEDVSEKDWYYQDLMGAYRLQIIQGTSEKEFSPDTSLTRAEFCAMVMRLQNLCITALENLLRSCNISLRFEKKSNDIEFSDVAVTDWYYEDVKNACNLGIVQGMGDGYFAPDYTIIRAEMATMLNRFLKYIDNKNNQVIEAI